MAIINRLSRLFKADLHAVLDHIEEPEQLLKQSIREMQETLLALDAQITQRKLERDDLSNRQAKAQTRIVQVCDEISLCFDNDNEDLARGLVRRKLETEVIMADTKETKNAVEKALTALHDQYAECSSLLESTQRKADLVTNSHVSRDRFCANQGNSVTDDDVEIELLKERQQYNSN